MGVNRSVYKETQDIILESEEMSQVQLRLPPALVKRIDKLVEEGKYKNRSDAIRIMISNQIEFEKTRDFLGMLQKRSEEAEKHPENLIPLED
jgi:Arc/MetJ-type ribon-helix-helix transcriptional regulator